MLKKILASALLLVALSCAVAQQPTQKPAPVAPQTHLKIGQRAPDFALTDTAGKEVKLADFRGKKGVVLAFYVLAFTGG
jgi:cytochrome oxidase Cu insertion factor (SCO1/SenC/PrrC family)